MFLYYFCIQIDLFVLIIKFIYAFRKYVFVLYIFTVLPTKEELYKQLTMFIFHNYSAEGEKTEYLPSLLLNKQLSIQIFFLFKMSSDLTVTSNFVGDPKTFNCFFFLMCYYSNTFYSSNKQFIKKILKLHYFVYTEDCVFSPRSLKH